MGKVGVGLQGELQARQGPEVRLLMRQIWVGTTGGNTLTTPSQSCLAGCAARAVHVVSVPG